MSVVDDKDNKKTILGLSQFDATVITVVIVLIVATVVIAYLGRPARLGAMIAYLYPASDDVPNLWLAPLDNPDDAQQVTFSNIGIYDFDTDRQGRTIAYSMRDEETLSRDIYLLDLQSGNTRQVTFCGDEASECYTPVFHPSDPVIAYVRVTQNSGSNRFGGAPRIWVLDLAFGTNRQLATDSQLIGHSPVWSDDGNTIAYYSADLASQGVMVYNFDPQASDTQSLNFVPALNGSVGALAPNGRSLLVPDIVNRGEQVFTYLKMVDFTQSPATFGNFTDPNAPIDDIAVEWQPSGDRATIARRYTDNRWTRGYQLYEIDIETGEETTLIFDEQYSHHFFTWDHAGERLLMQRLPLLNDDGSINNLARPEIWVLDYTSGELTLVTDSAYLPRWVIPQ